MGKRMMVRLDSVMRCLSRKFKLGAVMGQLMLSGTVQPVVDVESVVKEKRTVVLPSTAGNVVCNVSSGVGKRWKVLRGKINLLTDATVANRQIQVDVTDGTVVIEALVTGAVQAASLNRFLHLGEIVVSSSIGFLGSNNGYLGIQNLVLEGLDQLSISVVNGVAGDTVSGYLVVIEDEVSY